MSHWIMSNQSGKLVPCTTEALRSQRKDFFVCRGGADRQKPSVSNKLPWANAPEFMENRYLPILHEDISLSVLRVSNEHPTSRCEWAVKLTVWDVNYLPFFLGTRLLT